MRKLKNKKLKMYLFLILSGLFIFLSYRICLGGPLGGSLTREELADTLHGLDYSYVQGQLTLSGSATFYGYATQLFIKSNGGTTTWTTNAASDTGYLKSGESFGVDFEKVVSSPMIITATLPTGATLQYYVGGLKKAQ